VDGLSDRRVIGDLEVRVGGVIAAERRPHGERDNRRVAGTLED
jgi:hypothetical protein